MQPSVACAFVYQQPQQVVSLSASTGVSGSHIYCQLGPSLPLSLAKFLLAPLRVLPEQGPWLIIVTTVFRQANFGSFNSSWHSEELHSFGKDLQLWRWWGSRPALLCTAGQAAKTPGATKAAGLGCVLQGEGAVSGSRAPIPARMGPGAGVSANGGDRHCQPVHCSETSQF